MKIFIVMMLVVILSFLARALVLLSRPPSEVKDRAGVVNALTWRIGLSVALFAFILLAVRLGWLRPG